MAYNYIWYFSDSIMGASETYDKAWEKLQSHVGWDLKEGHIEVSCDWSTEYFWKNVKESINDDGAYTPSISRKGE